tara:strand:+ start:57659 stop:57856 length:198 start_codon:yes stop_codon:yes gene_type:complete
MNGKGDKPRPVDKQKYDDNFADIFGEYVPLWKRKGRKQPNFPKKARSSKDKTRFKPRFNWGDKKK